MKRLSRSILVTFVVAALTCVGPAALAAWNKSGNGQGEAKATSMPSGNAPTGTVSNRTLTVTWTAVTMPGGIPVDGYKVFRYNAGGTAFPVTGSCTGTVAGLTCTETAMAPGDWRYTVAPVYRLWQGAEGPMSLSDTVLAPVLNLTGSTNITSFPGTLNGSVNNYIPGQTLTMRLDNPTTGQVLAATITPNTIPANGTASVQVTVPNTVADGPHTLYAAGSAGDQAGAAFTVNAPALTPTLLQLINGGGGTTGLIQQNDSIQITYSQPLLVSSVCAGAPDDNQPMTAPGYVRITNNDGTSGHDRVDDRHRTLCRSASTSGRSASARRTSSPRIEPVRCHHHLHPRHPARHRRPRSEDLRWSRTGPGERIGYGDLHTGPGDDGHQRPPHQRDRVEHRDPVLEERFVQQDSASRALDRRRIVGVSFTEPGLILLANLRPGGVSEPELPADRLPVVLRLEASQQ